MIKKYFLDIKKIISKRNKWLYFSFAAVFLLSYFLSYYVGSFFNSKYPEDSYKFLQNFYNQDLFNDIKTMLSEKNYLAVFFTIFTHNYSLSVLNFILSLTFVLPFILILTNGLVVGFLFGIVHTAINYSITYFVLLYLVLILESVAMILSATEGLHLIYSVINPKKMWRVRSRKVAFVNTFKENVKILILTAIILFISGIIELISIYYELKVSSKIIMT